MDSDDNSPNTSAVLMDGEEFQIKPMRLLKARDPRRQLSLLYGLKRMLMALIDLLKLLVVAPAPDLRRQLMLLIDLSRRLLHLGLSEPTGEFQCRPIRLGLRLLKGYGNKLPGSSLLLTPVATTFPSQALLPAAETTENHRKLIEIRNLPISKPSPAPVALNPDGCNDTVFALCLVDFHHQRGPEVQWWKSNYHPEHLPDLFENLLFQALPDGLHLFEETFSNFNLVYNFKTGESIDDMAGLNHFQGDPRDLKTLFGCLCVRQVKTTDLAPEEQQKKDFTRLIVQKAVVVIVRKQPVFAKIKEKLLIITRLFFMQETFDNVELLEELFINLNSLLEDEDTKEETEGDKHEDEFFVNLDLRATVLKFKADLLVIFKAMLLDKKIIIYSNNNLEMLTRFQNNLISLIPQLIALLDNLGCPLIDYVETNGPLSKPTSLNTTNRALMLRFFGLPLQVFNTKNAFWNPYLPLQQLDMLAIDLYMVGCLNLLFVNQAPKFGVDMVVNLDTASIDFPCGREPEFHLSHDDKKFMSDMVAQVEATASDTYVGNDDYIRYHFEDYIVLLLSTSRFRQYQDKFHQPPPGFDTAATAHGVGDTGLFGLAFYDCWKTTNNYKIWNATADEFIFNFAEPKHLGVDIEDVGGAYRNISNFFASWKQPKTAAEPGAEPENGPQKFIKEHKKLETTELATTTDSAAPLEAKSQESATSVDEDDNPINKLISSWSNWGKKK